MQDKRSQVCSCQIWLLHNWYWVFPLTTGRLLDTGEKITAGHFEARLTTSLITFCPKSRPDKKCSDIWTGQGGWLIKLERANCTESQIWGCGLRGGFKLTSEPKTHMEIRPSSGLNLVKAHVLRSLGCFQRTDYYTYSFPPSPILLRRLHTSSTYNSEEGRLVCQCPSSGDRILAHDLSPIVQK